MSKSESLLPALLDTMVVTGVPNVIAVANEIRREWEVLYNDSARYRAALEEIRRLKNSIRDGGLCDTGSPYLEGRLRAFKEASQIAHRALHPEEDANDRAGIAGDRGAG